jgi:hypothetical protein
MPKPELIDDGECQPVMPWPFPGDVFPRALGAVVMRNVLSGSSPALQVVHFDDGYWGVADGHHVPSSRNLEPTHIWHVLEMDASLAELATLPPGRQADREALGEPWVVSPIDTTPYPTWLDRLRAIYVSIRYGEAEGERRWVERFGTSTATGSWTHDADQPEGK